MPRKQIIKGSTRGKKRRKVTSRRKPRKIIPRTEKKLFDVETMRRKRTSTIGHDAQGYGENIDDGEQVYLENDDQGYGENIDDIEEYLEKQAYEINDEPAAIYGDQYFRVDKQQKPSLWDKIKKLFSKLVSGTTWEILEAFIDTVLTVTPFIGPFYIVAKILTNNSIKWIRTKVEGKMAEYLGYV